MGVLTETMMRLRGEIGAWRRERVVLRDNLVRKTDERRTRVSALRAEFTRDRAGAHRAWFGPTLSERQAEERLQQQQAKEARAKAQQEQEQKRLVEEAKAKSQREQALPATTKLQPQGHSPAKPFPSPSVPLVQAQRSQLKGSKKH
jgi:hypothetical protein